VQSLVCKISRAHLSRADVRHCAQWNIVLFSYNLTVACHICVQPTVDYKGVTRTVGVVWVCRRFEYSHFCRHFGVAVLTCRRFDHGPSIIKLDGAPAPLRLAAGDAAGRWR